MTIFPATLRAPPTLLVALGVATLCAYGCNESETSPDEDRIRPLQPLVYTEDPEQTPREAAARERRLLRRLRQGADERGDWGTMKEPPSSESLPSLDSADALGRALFGAFVERDETLWDYAFIAPRDYASLVNIGLDEARTFVDRKQAAAEAARRAFRIERTSQAPRGGLESLFEFEALELGEPRLIDGEPTDDEDEAAQYWHNELRITLSDADVTFLIRIPKVLRLDVPGKAEDGEGAPPVRLGVASEMSVGPKLRVFLNAGLHLKPALLQPDDYPFPVQVGNFWRFERRTADSSTDSGEEAPRIDSPLTATQSTVSVEDVDRFGARRLVHLRTRYNDPDLTRREAHWLLTPRRIFLCSGACPRRVGDLDWLLSHLRRQTPIFVFPLERGDRWGGSADSGFRVGDEWVEAEVPAGAFFGSLRIEGLGPLAGRLPFGSMRNFRRVFAPGKGIVERRFTQTIDGEPRRVVESLVDYRIMAK